MNFIVFLIYYLTRFFSYLLYIENILLSFKKHVGKIYAMQKNALYAPYILLGQFSCECMQMVSVESLE